jgi:hypothetical protein
MIQTTAGRLILPARWCGGGARAEYDAGCAMGTVKGHTVNVSGHAHYPEIDVALVYYSEDEGGTWRMSENYILAWPDDGYRGAYAVDEPTVAEVSDGRLLMFGRSTLGRIVESWSEDGGTTWTRALPNGLCNSYSPVRLRRIPATGHLHCVWNQVSAEEIRRGFRRFRLSSAISKDDGQTWEHFKTLDCADPLDPSPRIEPDQEPEFVIAKRDCGEMPANFCIFRYPDAHYIDDMAYVSYDRETFKYPGSPQRQRALRAMPIEALYDDVTDLRLSNKIPKSAETAKGEGVED